MITLEWSASLDTGIGEVDDEHRELFTRVNDLFVTLGHATLAEEIEAVQYFETFVLAHFRAEELRMQQLGYANLAAHKRDHTRIRRLVAGLRESLHSGRRVDRDTLAITNGMLGNILVQHTCTFDKEFGASLMEPSNLEHPEAGASMPAHIAAAHMAHGAEHHGRRRVVTKHSGRRSTRTRRTP